jgi:amidohydrolase
MNPTYQKLLSRAKELESTLIELRRYLHRHPELSWKEEKTSQYVRDQLAKSGITTDREYAEFGFSADIVGGKSTKESKHIAYRADMDALPIEDRKKCDYKSESFGLGHMCGHDVHTTIAFGVAQLINELKDELTGKYRVFWQPAEESPRSGAPEMIRDGVLEDIDMVMGIHVDPTTESGKFRLTEGPDTAGVDSFKIRVEADSTTHTARPHTGKDTVYIANDLIGKLYAMIGRYTDPRDPSVLSIGILKAGDEALNVIPQYVLFGGTVRTTAPETSDLLMKKIEQYCASIADLYDVDIQLDFGHGAPAVQNDIPSVKLSRKWLEEVSESGTILDGKQSMGAEDFGYYTQKVPAVFTRVGSSNGPATSHPLHSSLFDIDEDIIAETVAKMAFLMINHAERSQIS